jgi:hypothetical protein
VSSNGQPTTTVIPGDFEVDLPAGGRLWLQSDEEVELWNTSSERYVDDYQLAKTNDLVLLGAILQQQIVMFRAQRLMNGMEPEIDGQGLPTGKYIMKQLDPDEMASATNMLNKASQEVTRIEKVLGIDKVGRESGSAHTLANYLKTLKDAAHARGIHISKRTIKYEEFVNGLRWRLRLMRNGDAEDRAYHDLTPDKVLDWCWGQLEELEQADKEFAKEYGKLFVGRL